ARDPIVLAALGQQLMRQGTPEALAAAEQNFKQAIAAGSTSSADFENLANLLANSGNVTAAITTLQQGIALNPYSNRLYKSLALRYVNARQYHEALETMKKELSLFPEDSFMRSLIAHVESGTSGTH
ncbi:MAG: tetratricopeptide repeat protein, partial [Candidatus Dormibacteraceae bacterium]